MQEITDLPHDLMMLVEVVEAGGFSAASQRTGISKSRLSRRIAALEERLGVALLMRNARHFEVTEKGKEMFQRGLNIRDETRAALAAAQEGCGEPSGLLRVACPIALASFLIGDVAIAFARAYPRVTLTMKTTDGSAPDEHVDLTIQPARRALADSSMVAQQLMATPYGLVASRQLIAETELAVEPGQQREWPTVGWSFDEHAAKWTLWGPQGETCVVPVKPRLYSDNLLVIRKAAIAGIGVAQLPLVLCQQDIDEGTLGIVAPGWAPLPMAVYAIYPSRHHLTQAGRLFLAALSQALSPGGVKLRASGI
ncbi:LysR substrate-binding domain-containing protein [Variovorax sp. E3]|uniref:LysR substrate-binding domain-containing protein n=1 Tax=Variovorax sp. E3 TaxID=1914993 RepID=UPI0018DC3346|nr:LysR substrate-binding domain-containing protein [Variovorax sp. E3]